ncbi:Hemolysin activation/secretion protein [Roseateles sp. YR242]|uniref:ShlB/FhaC/HecB family hemolysin secretion/activation protein n=1 Tax=Roseateles sp. YR242 TaxID=1855305 RepID=UPI0008B21EB4|nr:ShlB/FhaC/HecB family hemolysin secretion/activation protein [Roseateles sp. YR242]SEL22528.1 Hemolysin activation/secretion protein [Roseateles sp. YR242]
MPSLVCSWSAARVLLLCAAVVLVSLIPGGAQAQAGVPSAGPSAGPSDGPLQSQAQRQDQQWRAQEERRLERQERLARQPDVTLETPDSVQVASPAGTRRLPRHESPCFPILQVLIEGVEAAPALARHRHALAGTKQDDAPEGRCLGAAGIALLAARLQDALIAAGYVTTRVLAPAQDLSTGHLRLTIIAGRVHRIRVVAGSSPALRLANALDLGEGDLLDLRELEQALENLQRVPGVSADLQIAPAAEEPTPGYSDILVHYQGGRAVRLQWTLDDSGSEGTGRFPLAITGTLDQPLWFNDLFYLTWQRDAGDLVRTMQGVPGPRGGSHGLSLHYSWPWRHWLVGLNLGRQGYRQVVAGAYQYYLYRGQSAQGDLKLTRLLWRDGRHKFSAWWRLTGRSSRNFIDDTEVDVQRRRAGGVELGLSLRKMAGAWRGEASAGLRRGTGAFHALQAPEETFGEGFGRARVVTGDLSINGGVPLGGRHMRLSAQWRGQMALRALISQDRFSVGGRYSVRGTDARHALSGDHGLLARHEAELPLSAHSAAAALYLALDAGAVKARTAGANGRRVQHLVGLALGLRLSGSRPLPFQLDVFAGAPVRASDSHSAAQPLAGFNLSFSP